jgi:hypothetical protein
MAFMIEGRARRIRRRISCYLRATIHSSYSSKRTFALMLKAQAPMRENCWGKRDSSQCAFCSGSSLYKRYLLGGEPDVQSAPQSAAG